MLHSRHSDGDTFHMSLTHLGHVAYGCDELLLDVCRDVAAPRLYICAVGEYPW